MVVVAEAEVEVEVEVFFRTIMRRQLARLPGKWLRRRRRVQLLELEGGRANWVNGLRRRRGEEEYTSGGSGG